MADQNQRALNNAVNGIQDPGASARPPAAAVSAPTGNGRNPETVLSEDGRVPVGIEEFPEDIGRSRTYMTFSFQTYERPRVNSPIQNKSTGLIRLPIPSNLKDSYMLNYASTSMGAAGYVFDEAGAKVADAAQKFGNFLTGAVQDRDRSSAYSAGSSALTAIGGALPEYGRGLVAQYASGFPAGIAALQSLGYAVNPYLSIIFEGVNFKSYNFTWRFMPRSESESERIFNIIERFKKNAHPGVNGVLFTIPSLVHIEVFPKSFLPFKFKKCFITGIGVDYAPNAFPSFFNDGAPTAIDLTLQLQEVEIRTENDFVAQKPSTIVITELPDITPPNQETPVNPLE